MKLKTIRLSKVKLFVCLENKNDLKKFDKTVFDYVVNCGGYVDHKNKKTYKSHYVGCLNLTIILKKKISKIIQIGSSAEYGKIQSPPKKVLNQNLQKLWQVKITCI